MEEKTLFKLARAITDTGTDIVSSEGGTVTYRITSLKRELVNGKVTRTSTSSCTLGSAPVSWATWGGVTVGDGYLDVKINYSKNIGSSRSTTLTFTQNESNNKINLTVTQKKLQVASTFTLQGLTPDSNYFLFASGHFPLSNTVSQYLMIMGISSKITLPIPCTVNMSSPGQRSEANTGDRVSVYQHINGSFVSAGSFTVPRAGGTVSI